MYLTIQPCPGTCLFYCRKILLWFNFSDVRMNAARCIVLLYSLLYCILLYCITLYSTIQYHLIRQFAQFHLSLHDSCLTGDSCTLLFCTVLSCNILYCTVCHKFTEQFTNKDINKTRLESVWNNFVMRTIAPMHSVAIFNCIIPVRYFHAKY